jgi:hypothetical protein
MDSYEYEIFKRGEDRYIYFIYKNRDIRPIFPETQTPIFDSEGLARISAQQHINFLKDDTK